jgi:hypothetical protein
MLIGLMKLSKKKKKGGQVISTATPCFSGPNPLFDGLRQLVNAVNSPAARSVDPVLIELLGKRMRTFLAGVAGRFATE